MDVELQDHNNKQKVEHSYIICKQTRSIIYFYASFVKEETGKIGHNNGRGSCSEMCI